MEAWKFFDQSRASPVFALGLTARRWGLEPLPTNLVAIAGFRSDIKNVDGSVARRSEASPAPAKIIGLAYGIATIIVVMAWFALIREKLLPNNRVKKSKIADKPIPGFDKIFQEKQQPAQPSLPPQAVISSKVASEVAHCSTLVRQMYGLDLEIYGLGSVVDAEIEVRETKKRKADALFTEIRRIALIWRANPGRFSDAEREYVDEISQFVDKHEDRLYSKTGKGSGSP